MRAICQNCQRKPVHSYGRCNACHQYQLRHNGAERPEALWANTRHARAYTARLGLFQRTLTRLRIQSGLSIETVARRVPINRRYWWRLQTEQAYPTRELVLGLARALGLKARDRDLLLIAAGYAPDWLTAAVTRPDLLYRLWAEVTDTVRSENLLPEGRSA